MKFNKILITGFDEFELSPKTLKSLGSIAKERIYFPENSPQIKKHQADVDCLLVKFNPVNQKTIDRFPKLKYIGVLGTGFGKIDINYAKSKGIVVTNVPGYSTESVAEFVFAVILEHLRNLEKGKTQARKGNYSEDGFVATEIKGKNFGVLGLGRIGGRVAELALGFGADVQYWSRKRKKGLERKGIKYTTVASLVSKCDFLSLHLSLSDETEGFLDSGLLAKVKKGAVIINTSPMELVDIKTLQRRLKSGDITFILDHSDEMSEKNLKALSKYKNCIIYPPIAYVSKEAKEAKQDVLVENIKSFLKDGSANRVN